MYIVSEDPQSGGFIFMTDSSIILTNEGYLKLQSELEVLTTEKRPHAVARLKNAREMGDLKENSEYAAAKEGLSFVDERIAEIEAVLSKAQVTEASVDKSIVQIGDKITLLKDNATDVYMIVGEHEADINQGKLSHKSPIGMVMLGKKKGDSVKVQTPNGLAEYKILDIK